MKKLLLVLVLLTAPAYSQKVEVTQGYVDDATRSFKEVVALREAVASLEKAGEAKDATIRSLEEVVAAKDEVIKAKEEKNLLLMDQIDIYRKMKCDKTSFLFGLIKNTRCR